jgi:23S rRNA (guanine2445-N2)-methyltransferase / 23S rRNA (guanine2069-N7)-methyltransferase
LKLAAEEFDLIATCAFGLEAIVRRELDALGVRSRIGEAGRVHFRGTRETICEANLWLRTADRVLIRFAEFAAPDFEALFETTRALSWGERLPRDASFPVTGRSIQSTLSSVPACQRAVKRAIVDALRRDHATGDLPETGSVYAIEIGLLKDNATLTIDTTGRSLHRRGYRTAVTSAPLKETLAAALVMLSFWRRDRPLIDPFCGSGTIPIEAAMIGRNLAPGRHRPFAAESWPDFPQALWQHARLAADEAQLSGLEERLIGVDVDKRALQAARANAGRAGVADDIHFQAGHAQAVRSSRRFGCLITNPPYGGRIGDRDELDQLYAALPLIFRRLPTWSHYVLTAYGGFERVVGRTADRRRKLYNGRIECTYYQFHGPKPVMGKRAGHDEADAQATDNDVGEPAQSKPYVHAVGVAAFGELDDKAAHQAGLFAARLGKRARHLRRWPTRRDITCFRLYERDIPEIPLVVDRYEDYLHITEYQRPHQRDPAAHASWLELMADTAAETLQLPQDHVFLKQRRRQRGRAQHEKQDDTGHRIEVREGGLKFLVNLADYVDTGLFLDHRLTRQMIRDQAEGKTFLNLFAYTGSFTVYAAAGGAERTVSVDLSPRYLGWARDNLKLNGLDSDQHRFVAEDVTRFIRRHPPGAVYDLVVLDVPTYSNSKRTDRDWNVQIDSVELLGELLPLVKPAGVIYFSSNYRRIRFDPSPLPISEVHEISKQTVPEDFRNKRIHRCWRIVK